MPEPTINSALNSEVLLRVHANPAAEDDGMETVFSFIQQLSCIKDKDCVAIAINQVLTDLQMSKGFYINTVNETDGSLELFLSSSGSGNLLSSDFEKFTST